MTLDFILTPTYDIRYINVVDISKYDATSPYVFNPTIVVTVPGGFDEVSVPFSTGTYNIFDSTILGITEEGTDKLPDGIYKFHYSVNAISYVDKTIIKVDALLEKFDEAFMKLDVMQCDQAIKRQEKVQLDTIFNLIQGAIASANNCAEDQALVLYKKADKLLTKFISNSVCCGGTFLTQFTY
jgi:hypothetical protein